MTLYKQLMTGILSILVVLMLIIFSIELKAICSHLEEQQRSEVNNTINTVGLALAPYLEDKDQVAVESVINALFDGSSYSLVRLKFLDTQDEIIRKYPTEPTGVPQWFSNLRFFHPIEQKTIITSGWLQLAEVEIVSHPGSIYSQLWKAFIRLAISFIIVAALSLATIAFIIHQALKPLQNIVDKMSSIAQNRFTDPLPIPPTKDLNAVVKGINTMSSKVEHYFQSQATEAQALREKAYIDPTSKLGNRAYFMNQLSSWLNDKTNGGAAIYQSHQIKELYDTKGYQAGDEMVKSLSSLFSAKLAYDNITIARISQSEFGFIFPNYEEEKVHEEAVKIIECAQEVHSDPTGISVNDDPLGVIYNHGKSQSTSSEILSLIDNAISEANSNPEQPYGYLSNDTDQTSFGKRQWKELVEQAIFNNWIQFRFQSAKNINGELFHKEVFSAIDNGSERYTANQYLFALEQLDASQLLDKYVISKTLETARADKNSGIYAINIAQNSIEQPGFIHWISSQLERYSDVSDRIHFELPESCFIFAKDHAKLFCDIVRKSGSDFGVDNYGRHFKSLDYINNFRPHYVKLDYLFTQHLDDERQTHMLSSISKAAHNLGLVTIASRVETQDQLNILSDNFVDVFQGFIIK